MEVWFDTKLILNRLNLYQGIDLEDKTLTLTRDLLAAQRQFEKDTGYEPFAKETRTERLTPPEFFNENLILPSNLLSLSSITHNGTTISSSDYLFEVGDDFIYLMREYDPTYKIVITGSFGYDEEVPEDVIDGLIAKVMLKNLRNLGLPYGDVQKVKEDSVMLEFDNAGGRSEVDRLEQEYDNIVQTYMRMKC